MSHDPHDGPDAHDGGAVLFDGCGECEHRSRLGMEGILALDDTSVLMLWNRMLNTERPTRSNFPNVGRYKSDAEARLGRTLYYLSIFNERYVLPMEEKSAPADSVRSGA
jgi:hypothetical protein